MEMEAKTALVSLILCLLAFLLCEPFQSPHLYSFTTLISNLGDQLLYLLVSRRTMVLLCHAILLFVAVDSGLLASQCTASIDELEMKDKKSAHVDVEADFVQSKTSELVKEIERRREVVKDIVVVGVKERCFNSDLSDDQQEGEEEEVEDLDEMNNKFDEFIAKTRRRMQMESLQLVNV